MSINFNVDGVKKNPVSIFAGVNGEKKKINKIYIGKNGLPLQVYPGLININNRFYLTTNKGIISSADGKNWTLLPMKGIIQTISSLKLAYGNGIFLLSVNNYYIYKSNDLINWEYTASLYSSSYFGFVGDRFIAIYTTSNSTGSNFLYSIDGVMWNSMSGLSAKIQPGGSGTAVYIYNYSDFYYLNGVYICHAWHQDISVSTYKYYQIIYYSEDGATWKISKSSTSTTSASYYNKYNLYCFNDRFICTYYHNNSNKPFIEYSIDGKTWTQTTLPSLISGTYIAGITYVNGIYIFVTYNNNYNSKFYASEDLINWENIGSVPRMSPYVYFVNNDDFLIAYSNGYLSSSNKYYYDKINKSWNELVITEYTDSNQYISSIDYCNDKFFMISNSSQLIFYSLSGIDYFPCYIDNLEQISMNLNNNIFYIDNNGNIRG